MDDEINLPLEMDGPDGDVRLRIAALPQSSWTAAAAVVGGGLRVGRSDVIGPEGIATPTATGASWQERLGSRLDDYRAESRGGLPDDDLLRYFAVHSDALGAELETSIGLVRRTIVVSWSDASEPDLEFQVLLPAEALHRPAQPGVRGVLPWVGVLLGRPGEWTSGWGLGAKNSPQPEYRSETGQLPRLATSRSLRAGAQPPVSDPLELHRPGVSQTWDRAYERFFRPLIGVAPPGYAPRRSYRSVTARYIDPRRLWTPLRPFFSVDDTASVSDIGALGFRPSVTELYAADVQYDSWMVDRMLNGVHPCLFRRGRDDSEYVVDLNWNDYGFSWVADRNYLAASELHKQAYEQPNVRATLRKVDERLQLAAIAIQYRKEPRLEPVTDPEHLEPWREYTPADHDRWRYAKHVFRCAWSFAGQTDVHLTRGHLLSEQYLAALRVAVEDGDAPQEGFYRPRDASEQHPLWRLLHPFLREVDRINAFGDSLVIGPTGVLPVLSALSSQGAAARLSDQLSGLDWKGFQPREPVDPTHRFAHVANLYWAVLSEYVTAEVEREWAEYEAQWEAVDRFSRTLTERSLPHRPYGGVPATEEYWHDVGELSTRTTGEPAMSRVRAKNKADVIALATHAIYHATFFHSWVNDRQWEDCADPAFCSFALMTRREPGPDEAFSAWLLEAWPLVKHAAFQKALMTVLAHLDVGYIARDTTEPVYEGLRARLRARAEDFSALSKTGRFAELLARSAAQPEHGAQTEITQIRARTNT